MEKKRIVFSGSGGQGVITASIMLAQAAVIHENLNAVQSQSYGPEARGGSTRSDVIISNKPIYYPKVDRPEVLITLTQEAYNKFFSQVMPGGVVITDDRFVKQNHKIDANQISIPMYKHLMEEIGNPIVHNICTLGALIALTNIVKPESLLKILEGVFAPDIFQLNKKAFELGMRLGLQYKPDKM